jgi:hypothetical protein
MTTFEEAYRADLFPDVNKFFTPTSIRKRLTFLQEAISKRQNQNTQSVLKWKREYNYLFIKKQLNDANIPIVDFVLSRFELQGLEYRPWEPLAPDVKEKHKKEACKIIHSLIGILTKVAPEEVNNHLYELV